MDFQSKRRRHNLLALLLGKRIALLGIFLLIGCGESSPTEPDRTDLTGNWFGTFVSQGDVFELRWTLTDLNPAITGTGTFGSPGIALTINITGSHQEPNVTLTITATVGGTPLTYQGMTQGTNTVGGTLTTATGQFALQMARQ